MPCCFCQSIHPSFDSIKPFCFLPLLRTCPVGCFMRPKLSQLQKGGQRSTLLDLSRASKHKVQAVSVNIIRYIYIYILYTICTRTFPGVPIRSLRDGELTPFRRSRYTGYTYVWLYIFYMHTWIHDPTAKVPWIYLTRVPHFLFWIPNTSFHLLPLPCVNDPSLLTRPSAETDTSDTPAI